MHCKTVFGGLTTHGMRMELFGKSTKESGKKCEQENKTKRKKISRNKNRSVFRYLDVSRANTIYQTFNVTKCERNISALSAHTVHFEAGVVDKRKILKSCFLLLHIVYRQLLLHVDGNTQTHNAD